MTLKIPKQRKIHANQKCEQSMAMWIEFKVKIRKDKPEELGLEIGFKPGRGPRRGEGSSGWLCKGLKTETHNCEIAQELCQKNSVLVSLVIDICFVFCTESTVMNEVAKSGSFPRFTS